MATLILLGHYVASKVGKTGITVTIDLHRITQSDASVSEIVTGGSCTEVGDGAYLYRYASADLATYVYVGVMKTADATVDAQHIPVLGIVIPDELTSTRLATSGYTAPPSASTVASQVRTELTTELGRVDVATSSRNATTPPTASAVASQVRTELTTELARIDGTVTSRLASASYTTPPTVGAIADQVWDEVLSGHTTSGTTGAALNRVGTGEVTVVSPVLSDGTGIALIRGDDYLNTDSRALTFTGTTWPTLTSGTVALRVQFGTASVTAYSGTVTGAQACRVELTDTQTAAMSPGVYAYDLEAVLSNGSVVTLVQGVLSVGPDVR